MQKYLSNLITIHDGHELTLVAKLDLLFIELSNLLEYFNYD